MKHEQSRGKPLHCPICGGELHPRWIDERYEFDDLGTTYPVESKNIPIEDCHDCGESYSGPEAAQIRHESLGRALGLLTPDEIKRIRNLAGWTLDQFATKIGVDLRTVGLWEDGDLWQNRSQDLLIRLLGADRRNMDRLTDRNFKPDEIGSNVEATAEPVVQLIGEQGGRQLDLD